MKKVNIIDFVIVILSICIGFFAYLKIDVEGFLWSRNEQPFVSLSQIEENITVDFTGKPAGNDTFSLNTIEEWEDVLNEVDYVTVSPKSIYKTDVYSLSAWEEHFTRRRNGTLWRRKSEVRIIPIDYDLTYSPFYIIELPDGNHIIAQINRCIADDISKGKEVKLPLGQKKGILQAAKNALSKYEEEYNISTDTILYSIDDEWQAKNKYFILFGKCGVGVAAFFVVAVILELICYKVFKRELIF